MWENWKFWPTSPRILTFHVRSMFLTHSCSSGIGVLRPCDVSGVVSVFHDKGEGIVFNGWYRKSQLLSSSRTSVPMKLGLFNAKIHNENGRYIYRLIYQLNEQDLLCHSIQNVSLILVTSKIYSWHIVLHCTVVLYGQLMITLLLGVFMLLIMMFLDSCFIYLGIRECLIFLSRSTYQTFQCLGGN